MLILSFLDFLDNLEYLGLNPYQKFKLGTHTNIQSQKSYSNLLNLIKHFPSEMTKFKFKNYLMTDRDRDRDRDNLL